MRDDATNDQGPPTPRVPRQPGCAPADETQRRRCDLFFGKAIDFLSGERLIDLHAFFEGMPLEALLAAFATPSAPTLAPARASLDPRIELFHSALFPYFGVARRAQSKAWTVQFLQQRLCAPGLDVAGFLRAFPTSTWIPMVPSEYPWAAVARARRCWDEGAAQTDAGRGSGTRTKDLSRAYAATILSYALEAEFVPWSAVGAKPGEDPLRAAANAANRIGPKRLLDEVLVPAANTHDIANAHTAWDPSEAKTSPDCPVSIPPPKANTR